MSKTLATIDTKAPIAIGLEDLVYSGPDVENLGKFYDEMGFKQLKQALNVSSADVAEGLDFTIVDQISQDMLSEESIFHIELLVRITIRIIWLDLPGLVGISSMPQTSLSCCKTRFSRIS